MAAPSEYAIPLARRRSRGGVAQKYVNCDQLDTDTKYLHAYWTKWQVHMLIWWKIELSGGEERDWFWPGLAFWFLAHTLNIHLPDAISKCTSFFYVEGKCWGLFESAFSRLNLWVLKCKDWIPKSRSIQSHRWSRTFTPVPIKRLECWREPAWPQNSSYGTKKKETWCSRDVEGG